MPTVKEQIDEALRAEEKAPRRDITVYVNPRTYEHIRSYITGDRYRGAGVRIDPVQLEDWVIRVH